MFKLLLIVTLLANGWTNTMDRRAADNSDEIMTFPTREACEAQAKLDEPITIEMFKQFYGVTRGVEIELDFRCEPIGKPA